MENSAPRSNMTAIAIASNLAEKIGVSTNTNKVYSNIRSRKNKYSSNQKLPIRIRKRKRKNEKRCYELKSLELDKRTNSCIRVNIRELDRELFTK